MPRARFSILFHLDPSLTFCGSGGGLNTRQIFLVGVTGTQSSTQPRRSRDVLLCCAGAIAGAISMGLGANSAVLLLAL